MKKLSYLIVIVLISSLVLSGCSLLSNVGQVPTTEQSGITYLTKGGPTEAGADEFVLYAGQNIEVGVVKVWNDIEKLYVRYVITAPDWCLTETHLHVATELAGIPQTKKGNPIPGQFDYKDEYDCVTESDLYTIPLDGEWLPCETELYIAAHAVVQMQNGGEIQEETAWGGKDRFNDKNWATYFSYTIQCEYEEEWPKGGTTTIAFEDLPLTEGNDWDYNDWVADIDTVGIFYGTSENHVLTSIEFTIRPQAKIAGFWHVMHMENIFNGCDGAYSLKRDGVEVENGPYHDGTGLDVILVEDTGGGSMYEFPGIPADVPDKVVLTIIFDDPGAIFSFPEWEQDLYHGENLFFDPYIFVSNTSEEIHTGDIRMLTVPTDWPWPTPDGNAIWNVYPKVGATTNPLLGPVFCSEWWTP